MKVTFGIVVVALGLCFSGARLAGHHSAVAEYDDQKLVSFTGTVGKVEWTNPHARFFIDVVGENKAVASWGFELASPNVLTRAGWGKRTLNVGDVITATGYAARSGKTLALTRSVIAAGGKKLFTGTMGIAP